MEFEVPTLRITLADRLPETVSLAERLVELEHLEETRLTSTQRLHSQQHQMKERFDRPLIKSTILPGDYVLLYDSRYANFPGKLHTRWMGPYLVHQVFSNGSVQLANITGEVYPVRVNQYRLKPYFFRETVNVRVDASQLGGELCDN